MVAAAYGCRCHIAMPDDAALEKSQLLSALGAQVQRVRPVSITHPGHFVNVARRVGTIPARSLPLIPKGQRSGLCAFNLCHPQTYARRVWPDSMTLGGESHRYAGQW